MWRIHSFHVFITRLRVTGGQKVHKALCDSTTKLQRNLSSLWLMYVLCCCRFVVCRIEFCYRYAGHFVLMNTMTPLRDCSGRCRSLTTSNVTHDCSLRHCVHRASVSFSQPATDDMDYRRFAVGRAPGWRATFIADVGSLTGVPSPLCGSSVDWRTVRVRQTNDRWRDAGHSIESTLYTAVQRQDAGH